MTEQTTPTSEQTTPATAKKAAKRPANKAAAKKAAPKTDSKTVTVYHPAFPDVSREVPAADVDNWTEAGWRKTPLKSDEK